jgi:hypothetical protein
MLPIIKQWLSTNNLYLKPIYSLSAWILMITLASNIFRFVADVIKRTRKMHEIPCTNCRYFTNDYHLKCTIQPQIANTELAIDCPDFQKISIFS